MSYVKTGYDGSENYPVNTSEYLEKVIETIAKQDIKGLKSANIIADGFKRIQCDNGVVLEHAVIKMAEGRAFNRDDASRSAVDPKVAVKYHNGWEKLQYIVTIRDDEIEEIIANKGQTPEGVASEILDSLTQGESNEENLKQLDLLFKSSVPNYATIKGNKVPKTIKGAIYMMRDMYNHIKFNNSDLTEHSFISGVPDADIRIAISTDLLNLMDVSALADVFNLSKVELFGKLVVYDIETIKQIYPDMSDEQLETLRYRVFAYDLNSFGIAEKKRSVENERVARGRYTNFYLNVNKLFYHSGLFKSCYLDCIESAVDVKDDLLQDITTQTVNATTTHMEETEVPATVNKYSALKLEFKASTGYNLIGDDAVATVTMGGSDISETALTLDKDGKNAVVNIPVVTGNIVITLTAVADE